MMNVKSCIMRGSDPAQLFWRGGVGAVFMFGALVSLLLTPLLLMKCKGSDRIIFGGAIMMGSSIVSGIAGFCASRFMGLFLINRVRSLQRTLGWEGDQGHE